MHGFTLKGVANLLMSAVVTTPRLSKLLKMYTDLATADPDTISKNVRVFRGFIQDVGDVRCHEVTRLMVTQHLASLRKSGKADATVRGYGLSISGVFSFGIDNINGFTVNPCRGVKLPRIDKHLPRFWTEDEVKRFHEAIDYVFRNDPVRRAQWHGLLYVLCDSGLRIGEGENLRWKDFILRLDPEDKQTSVVMIRKRDDQPGQWAWKPKGRRDRVFPLSENCVSVLTWLQLECPWAYPFLPKERYEYLRANVDRISRRTKKRPRGSAIYKEWARIKSRAGVKGSGAFHRMRSTAARRYAPHLSERALRAGFGWQDASTADIYTGELDVDVEAIAKIQSITAGEGT